MSRYSSYLYKFVFMTKPSSRKYLFNPERSALIKYDNFKFRMCTRLSSVSLGQLYRFTFSTNLLNL